MLNLSKKNFSWLFIQLVNPVQIPLSVSRATLGIIPSTIRPALPIPLDGYFGIGKEIANLYDYVEVSAIKNLNVLTSTVSALFTAQSVQESNVSETQSVDSKGNAIYNVTEEGGLIKFANPNLTYAERGQETFVLSIIGGVGNPITVAIDGYLEIASKTTWNVRFHYISNNMVIFNMILNTYQINKTSLNPRMTFGFVKPQQAVSQGEEDIKYDSIVSVVT